jgi:hypothetical protein
VHNSKTSYTKKRNVNTFYKSGSDLLAQSSFPQQPPYPSLLYIHGKEARKVIFEEIRVLGVVSLHCITSVTGVELPGEL